MLDLTGRAAVVLNHMRRQEGIPDHFGLRVDTTASAKGDGQQALTLRWVEAPADGDQVGESSGVQLFVSDSVAQDLDEMALDVDGDAAASEARLKLCAK